MLTYLNEVDKHTANYACSGFGEKSAASFPTTKTWFALQIKALSGSTRPCGEEFWVCVFFFDDMSSRTSNGCFRSPSLSWYTALWWGLTCGVSHFSSSYQSESVWPQLLIKRRFSARAPLCTPLAHNYMKRIPLRVAARSVFFLCMLIILSLPQWHCLIGFDMLDLVMIQFTWGLKKKAVNNKDRLYHTCKTVLLNKTPAVHNWVWECRFQLNMNVFVGAVG